MIVTNLEVDSDVHQEPTLASKNYVEPFYMSTVVPKIEEPFASQSIIDSKGVTDANASIDSESPPVPAKDADTTMEQVIDLNETCLSSQGVAAVNPNLNETALVTSETAGRDFVSSLRMIPENLEYAQVATKLEETNVQQEPTLTCKSST